MNMKDHILTAMREQLERWEDLLGELSEEQIITPRFDLDWSIKDVMTHLWGWQQISIARMEAGLHDREPQFPEWVNELGKVWEEDANRTNDRIHELNHLKAWSEMYENWRNGYLRLLEAGNGISERDLLDGDRYPWLGGYSLAFILVASYEHHQEHYEKLTAWLKEL
jgi:hypothetical protein